MADVDHPKTRIENDKDAELPRTQPESPKHEGIDPLTEGDTMYPAEDVQAESERVNKAEEKEAEKALENEDDSEASEGDEKSTKKSDEKTPEDRTTETVKDQQELNAKANTPNAVLNDAEKGSSAKASK